MNDFQKSEIFTENRRYSFGYKLICNAKEEVVGKNMGISLLNLWERRDVPSVQ
jgi:hypothetical protein